MIKMSEKASFSLYLIFTAFFTTLLWPVSEQATLPGSPTDPRCFRHTNLTGPCVPLTTKSCLDTALPFSHTSVSLADDSGNLTEVYDKLNLWRGLKNVPQCWAVIQPFICAVYLPRCNDTIGVELPSKELCERTRKPCKIVQEINNGWPDFLDCENPNFVSGCGSQTYDKLTFNTTGHCEPPLVRTEDAGSWYDGVEGCGVPCNNPLFTEEQHKQVHTFIAAFGSICLVCTLFTVLTFIIDWTNANRYPARILFFINACFFLGSIGWMAQFAGDARKDIVCRRDGTIRRAEPQLGSNESFSCTIVFIIVYYFLVAGVSWFVMLAYAWYLTFTALGTPRDALTSKTSYFHIFSWCLPLVLTIFCLAISEIDGDSVSGICFVGGFNHSVRAGFVLVPVGLVIVVGTFFLLRGVFTLIKIRKEAPVFIPQKTFSKIRDTILRLGIFTAVALIFVFITFSVHVYIFANEDEWKSSFRKYMYCLANVSVSEPGVDAGAACVIENRPSLVAMEIHIFAFFGAGIAMSSWSWTKASLSAWERFFRWIFHKPSNKPVKLKRHRMIAQAFEKRKEINRGRVSISYRSSHDDPLGMKFDLNSGSDDELSSNFAMAMPQLVRRRNGLIYPVAGMARRYSDSDVASSISTRRVSRESQMMEFTEAQFFNKDGLPDMMGGRRNKKKKKKMKRGKLNRIRPVVGPLLTGMRFGSGRLGKLRKGSDSSVMSQISARSMKISVEQNHRHLDAVSLESVNAQDTVTVLPAVTKSDHDSTDAKQTSRLSPFLEFGPRKAGPDYNVFSGKNSTNLAAGLQAGRGGASSGMETEPSLPGAPDESKKERKSERGNKVLKEGQHFIIHSTPNQSVADVSKEKIGQITTGKAAAGRTLAVGIGGQTSSSSSPAPPPTSHQQQKLRQRRMSMAAHQTHKVTVETREVECKTANLESLMADISGGNWGVLLGKSGSSSGSEVGGGGASAYMSGGSGFLGGANPHYPYMVRPDAFMMSGVGPYMGGTAGYPYMGVPPEPYLMNMPHSYNAPPQHPPHQSPYMGVSGLQVGGAKQKGQWGHFPSFPQQHTGNHQQDRRWERERQREREIRRPNQAYMNSMAHMEDDDLEFIST